MTREEPKEISKNKKPVVEFNTGLPCEDDNGDVSAKPAINVYTAMKVGKETDKAAFAPDGVECFAICKTKSLTGNGSAAVALH